MATLSNYVWKTIQLTKCINEKKNKINSKLTIYPRDVIQNYSIYFDILTRICTFYINYCTCFQTQKQNIKLTICH